MQTDAEALARIHRTARAAAMPWLPVVHTPIEDLDFFRNHVLRSQRVWIVEIETDIAGFIAIDGEELEHLYVAPSYWRRGLGAKLIGHIQADAQTLFLWTFQQNLGARAFYRRFGFEEIEFTDGEANEERTPDVRLCWRA